MTAAEAALYIAVSQDLGVERPTLVVDCRQGRITLRATTATRSQSRTLHERICRVEGLMDLTEDLRRQTDDTRTTDPVHHP
jgi:hypothetical protein